MRLGTYDDLGTVFSPGQHIDLLASLPFCYEHSSLQVLYLSSGHSCFGFRNCYFVVAIQPHTCTYYKQVIQ